MAEGITCRTLSHFRLCWPLHGIKVSLRRAAYGRPALDPVPRLLALSQLFVSTSGSVLMCVGYLLPCVSDARINSEPAYVWRVINTHQQQLLQPSGDTGGDMVGS